MFSITNFFLNWPSNFTTVIVNYLRFVLMAYGQIIMMVAYYFPKLKCIIINLLWKYDRLKTFNNNYFKKINNEQSHWILQCFWVQSINIVFRKSGIIKIFICFYLPRFNFLFRLTAYKSFQNYVRILLLEAFLQNSSFGSISSEFLFWKHFFRILLLEVFLQNSSYGSISSEFFFWKQLFKFLVIRSSSVTMQMAVKTSMVPATLQSKIIFRLSFRNGIIIEV